jgi:hypothetical protein
MTLSPEHDHILANKVAYLNPKFFWGRVIFYFLVFNVLSFVMRHFSKKQDETGNPLLTLTMRKICYAGIPLFALSLTFAAFVGKNMARSSALIFDIARSGDFKTFFHRRLGLLLRHNKLL